MKPDFIKLLGLKKMVAGEFYADSVVISPKDLQRALEEKCEVVEGVVRIVKEECKHIPYIKYLEYGEGVYPKYAICELCGARLKAVAWEVEG